MNTFDVGYASFCKQAQLGLLQGVGEMAANMNINSDKRNEELDKKLDQIIAATAAAGGSLDKDKIKVVGADEDAKKAISKKKQIIEQILKELRAQGVI